MNGEEYGCKFSLLLPLCPSLNAHYHVNATDLRRPLKCFHGSRILTTCNAPHPPHRSGHGEHPQQLVHGVWDRPHGFSPYRAIPELITPPPPPPPPAPRCCCEGKEGEKRKPSVSFQFVAQKMRSKTARPSETHLGRVLRRILWIRRGWRWRGFFPLFEPVVSVARKDRERQLSPLNPVNSSFHPRVGIKSIRTLSCPSSRAPPAR